MPAATDTSRTPENIAALHDRLDDLWTQYLQFLDDYTSAQATIKKHLAAGYFSLTQANFKCSGRRYGRDFYDDRAAATTRVKVNDDGEVDVKNTLEGKECEVMGGATKDIETKKKSTGMTEQNIDTDEAKQLPSPSPTPEPDFDDTSSNTSGGGAATEKDQKTPRDPIRWFGILVPPTLRSGQDSFRSVVTGDDGVAKAVNAARSLRDLEAEIRKLRKTIRKAERDANQ